MPKEPGFEGSVVYVRVRKDQREQLDKIAKSLYENNLSRCVRDLIDIALAQAKPTLKQSLEAEGSGA